MEGMGVGEKKNVVVAKLKRWQETKHGDTDRSERQTKYNLAYVYSPNKPLKQLGHDI